jgi:hypothetical protein
VSVTAVSLGATFTAKGGKPTPRDIPVSLWCLCVQVSLGKARDQHAARPDRQPDPANAAPAIIFATTLPTPDQAGSSTMRPTPDASAPHSHDAYTGRSSPMPPLDGKTTSPSRARPHAGQEARRPAAPSLSSHSPDARSAGPPWPAQPAADGDDDSHEPIVGGGTDTGPNAADPVGRSARCLRCGFGCGGQANVARPPAFGCLIGVMP